MNEKIIALIATLVTAFVYYVGWSYLYFYYYFLGIDVFEISPSVQYTLIYSFPALLHLVSFGGELKILLGLLVVALLVIWIIHRLKGRFFPNDSRVKIGVISLAIALLALLIMAEGYRSAKSAAHIAAVDKWMNDSNPAILEPKLPEPKSAELKSTEVGKDPCKESVEPFPPLANKLECFNAKLKLRHILTTQYFHYLFARDDCDAKIYRMCEGLLFKIGVSELKKVIVLHAAESKNDPH